MNKLRSSKFVSILSAILFVLSISFFVYTEAEAYVQPESCETCSGRTSPKQDQECVHVDIGASDNCFDTSFGNCESSGSTFCD